MNKWLNWKYIGIGILCWLILGVSGAMTHYYLTGWHYFIYYMVIPGGYLLNSLMISYIITVVYSKDNHQEIGFFLILQSTVSVISGLNIYFF